MKVTWYWDDYYNAEADCDLWAGDLQEPFHVVEVFDEEDNGTLYLCDDEGLAWVAETDHDYEVQYTNNGRGGE